MLALATGCAQELSLQVRIGSPPASASRGLRAAPLVAGATVAAGIEIERVELVLREVRLESTPTVGDEASLGRKVVLSGPALLELSGADLNPGALTRFISGAPGGLNSFLELDADLRPVTPGEVRITPALAPLTGETLVISGRWLGEPFRFASDLNAVLKSEGVFLPGSNHTNIDLNFSPERWFLDDAGNVLDPTVPANQSAIERNVVDSFAAYEDDDLDGLPDFG